VAYLAALHVQALLACHLAPQDQLKDATAAGPHTCRLPGSTCNPAQACPGSLVTYSLAPRTGSFARPGVKDGTITIFTEPSGDVVVTVSLDCNCYISVVGANGNTINLGPEGSCPANMNGFTDPTLTSATGAPALLTCMSWVLPKARVDAALAASATPGAVVITSHFAVSCYSSCGTVSGTATATQVLSSGPAEDVRCDLAPFRGVVYRLAALMVLSYNPHRQSLSSQYSPLSRYVNKGCAYAARG
jgi:hypothetical protein